MENYLGEIRLFAGTYSPAGWNLCDGTLLQIADNPALFQLIGTTYGGDGTNTFAVPDLRGRVPLCQGTGTGLSPRALGAQIGEENHTLTLAEIAVHNHPAAVTSGTATTMAPSATVAYGTVQGNGDTYSLYTTLTQPTVTPHTMNINAVGATGGAQGHNNTMPTLPITYIIALSGIFPTQS